MIKSRLVQYSKKQVRDFMENKDSLEWPSDFLVSYYKTLARLIENNEWHPDYRGYVDDIWYAHYKIVTNNWNLIEYPDEDLYEDGELSDEIYLLDNISEVEDKIIKLWRNNEVVLARWEG